MKKKKNQQGLIIQNKNISGVSIFYLKNIKYKIVYVNICILDTHSWLYI